MGRGRVRRIGHIGVAAALAYAMLKAAWGLGSTVGITDVAAFERFVDRFGSLAWMATWGTVGLALVAAALLLALVEPWGRRLPQRPLRVAAWLGAAVLAVPGVIGLAEALLIAAGIVAEHDTGMATWVFLLTYGSFTVLAVALAAAAGQHARARRSGRRRGRRTEGGEVRPAVARPGDQATPVG